MMTPTIKIIGHRHTPQALTSNLTLREEYQTLMIYYLWTFMNQINLKKDLPTLTLTQETQSQHNPQKLILHMVLVLNREGQWKVSNILRQRTVVIVCLCKLNRIELHLKSILSKNNRVANATRFKKHYISRIHRAKET